MYFESTHKHYEYLKDSDYTEYHRRIYNRIGILNTLISELLEYLKLERITESEKTYLKKRGKKWN